MFISDPTPSYPRVCSGSDHAPPAPPTRMQSSIRSPSLLGYASHFVPGELEDALEIALKAAGGVHGQLLELGLSCEDLGKTSVHLSVAAQEAPEEVSGVAGGKWQQQ